MMRGEARASLRFITLALAAVCNPALVGADSVSFVIHISVDGLRGDLLGDLIASDATGQYANFQRMVDEGATTFNARTDFINTTTVPNHISMVTGRPVFLVGEQPNTIDHGYTTNTDPALSDTIHNQGNSSVPYVSSTFDVVHDNGLSTALYASKSKFSIFEQSYNATAGAPDVTGPDNGADKIDEYVNQSTGSPQSASNLHATFLADMAVERFNYSLLHYRDPDTVGHASGWGSAAWNDSVSDVDGYLGELLDMIENDALLDGSTTVILSSDHGGAGTDHNNPTIAPDYTVPFLAWGAGVTSGVDLYALNANSRVDPGTGRPNYEAPGQPIRNGDGANLALDLLGLVAVPGSSINSSQNLSVPEPGSAAIWCVLGWIAWGRRHRGAQTSACRKLVLDGALRSRRVRSGPSETVTRTSPGNDGQPRSNDRRLSSRRNTMRQPVA